MDAAKTQIIIDKKLWEKLKFTAKKKGLLLMPFLEEVLREYLNRDGKKNGKQ